MFEKINTNESMLSPQEHSALAEKLSKKREIFRFFGIEEMAYQKLKAESDEFPGFATHIDVLVQRFKDEGVKIVIEQGKVFALPYLSNDVENDSVFPRFLAVSDEMDRDLKTLIKAGKQPG